MRKLQRYYNQRKITRFYCVKYNFGQYLNDTLTYDAEISERCAIKDHVYLLEISASSIHVLQDNASTFHDVRNIFVGLYKCVAFFFVS